MAAREREALVRDAEELRYEALEVRREREYQRRLVFGQERVRSGACRGEPPGKRRICDGEEVDEVPVETDEALAPVEVLEGEPVRELQHCSEGAGRRRRPGAFSARGTASCPGRP
jgi:hypothetical protein